VDVAIEFVGPSPGEKLHEVLVGDDEVVEPSTHVKILRVSRTPVDPAWLEAELARLEHLVTEGETLELVGELRRVVTEPQRVAAADPTPAPTG
jgi:FlaA1/EpsC-like NDP-sugar epimerase